MKNISTQKAVKAEKKMRLTGGKQSIIDFFKNAPSLEGLNLERDRAPMRDISFDKVETTSKKRTLPKKGQ